MAHIPKSFEHMLAAWNEHDVTRIRDHLEKALSPNILFADPNYLIEGLDAFEHMVTDFRQAYPDATCEHTSGMDSHHNRYRYKWLVSVGGQPTVPGLDVAEVDNDGKITRIDGFFGPVPQK